MKLISVLAMLLFPAAICAKSCKIKFHGKDQVECNWYPSSDSQIHYIFDNDKADDLGYDSYPCWATGQSVGDIKTWMFNSVKGCWVAGYYTDDACTSAAIGTKCATCQPGW